MIFITRPFRRVDARFTPSGRSVVWRHTPTASSLLHEKDHHIHVEGFEVEQKESYGQFTNSQCFPPPLTALSSGALSRFLVDLLHSHASNPRTCRPRSIVKGRSMNPCILILATKPAFHGSLSTIQFRTTVCTPSLTTDQHGKPRKAALPAPRERTWQNEGRKTETRFT